MLFFTLKDYVVLRVDEVDEREGLHRELVAESALEGEAFRVGRMLAETTRASSVNKRGVCYEVRISDTGVLLESFPIRGREYPKKAEYGDALLEFPMRFASVSEAS